MSAGRPHKLAPLNGDGTQVKRIKSSLPVKIRSNNDDILDESMSKKTLPPINASQADKQKLCLEILTSGYVQAYVDFFYLTNRPDPHPDPTIDEELEIIVPPEDLMRIKDLLTEAESSRRSGDTKEVFRCFGTLAEYYQDQKDLKTSIYFYEKCLELAKLTNDVQAEMESTHHLGIAYEKSGDEEGSIALHEQHLALATEVNDKSHIVLANESLYLLYETKALRFESEENLDQALINYTKCLSCASAAGNEEWEMVCNYRIGKTLILLNRCEESLSYLTNYYHISRRMKNLKAQGQACSILGAAYQALGKQDLAIKHLKSFLELAEDLKDLNAMSEACYSLGVIYNNKGEFSTAVQFFTRNFELVKSIIHDLHGDMSLYSNARVALGMAQGNYDMNAYISAINTDYWKLLRWKISRIPLVDRKTPDNDEYGPL